MFTVNTRSFDTLPAASAYASALFNRTGIIAGIERQAVPMKKIKTGRAFQLEVNGPVWVRVRGGVRAGCGGVLHAARPECIVYPYSSGYEVTA